MSRSAWIASPRRIAVIISCACPDQTFKPAIMRRDDGWQFAERKPIIHWRETRRFVP
jgi:hypothetical protein